MKITQKIGILLVLALIMSVGLGCEDSKKARPDGGPGDCPSGILDASGSCVVVPEPCVSDANCADGRVCVEGSCAECRDDDGCSAGMVCIGGSCITPEAECGNGVCEAGEDHAGCAADCPAAAVCGDGVCAEDEEEAASCPDDCEDGGGGDGSVVCTSDGDCAGHPDGPVCKVATGECVECTDDSQCSARGLGYSCWLSGPASTLNTCAECYVDGLLYVEGPRNDCIHYPGRPMCDRDTRTCFRCINSNSCTQISDNLSINPPLNYCSAARGSCAQCAVNTHCENPEKPYCYIRQERCVECLRSTHCAAFEVCDDHYCATPRP